VFENGAAEEIWNTTGEEAIIDEELENTSDGAAAAGLEAPAEVATEAATVRKVLIALGEPGPM